MAKKKTKKAAAKSNGKPAKTPKMKQKRLNGLEDLPKFKTLDDVCERVSDAREALSEARGNEKDALQTALKFMRDKDVTVYKAHGIELVRVAGDEKVRCRVTGNQEGAEDADDTEGDTEGDEDKDSAADQIF